MESSRVKLLRDLAKNYLESTGVDPHFGGHSFVVDTSAAIGLLREFSLNRRMHDGLTVTADEDELFCVDDIPVRLRVKAPNGKLFLVPAKDMIAQSCCDRTAFMTIVASITRGNA